MPRHRPDARHVQHPGGARRRPQAGLGRAPDGRADADRPAEVRRRADRASPVGADPRDRRVGAEQRRLAAGRAARRVGAVERMQRAPDEQVVRLEGARALGRVRLRDDHRARGAQARDDRGVAERPVAGPRQRPRRGPPARDVEDVLDGQRQAEQDGVIARRAAGVGRVGCCEGIVVAALGDRVERGRVVEACEGQLDQLARADLAGAQPREPVPCRGPARRHAPSATATCAVRSTVSWKTSKRW